MPYSLFHKLYRGPLLAASFSLQLAYGSVTQPIGRLEDVSVNIGDIWVLEDFIVVNMPETDDTQIILGRPILATTSCHINVRKGHISFEVEGSFPCLVVGKRMRFLRILLYWMLYPFPLNVIWRMSCLLNILLIVNEFHMRTMTMGMLKWNFLLICHLANPRLRPLFLMILC